MRLRSIVASLDAIARKIFRGAIKIQRIGAACLMVMPVIVGMLKAPMRGC